MSSLTMTHCKFLVLHQEAIRYQCGRSAWRSDHCIFHLPKATAEQKAVMIGDLRDSVEAEEAEFRAQFVAQLEQMADDPAVTTCDLRYTRFPAIKFKIGWKL